MKPDQHRHEGMPALDLIEEGSHLLRRLPAAAWVEYLIGSIPFVLGLLYFTADMSRGAYAEDRLAPTALILTGLYFWLKYWHSMFAQSMRSVVHGIPRPSWSLRRTCNLLLLNAVVHPTGLLLMPLALVLTIPFPHLFAFYHNFTILADGEDGSLRANIARAARMAGLWTGQNIVVLLILKLFMLLVFLNWFITLFQFPYLLKMLLGIESAFTQGGSSAMMNTTYLATVGILTWLCVSPFIRAVYVLRCFYGESLKTGEDLRSELKFLKSNGLRQAAAAAIGLCLFASVASAAPDGPATPSKSITSVDSSRLDRALNEVLKQAEFTWRMPREAVDKERQQGWLGRTLESIGEAVAEFFRSLRDIFIKIIEWYDRTFGRDTDLPTRTSEGSGWQENLRAFVYILLIVVAVALVFLLYRLWRQRPATVAIAETVVPDLNDEDIAADDLPEDEWLQLAHDLMAKGESRLALRALYLACLAHLGERELVTISRAKSNREYQRELNRRARLLAEMRAAFQDNVAAFEEVWYGLHQVTRSMFEDFEGNLRKIREC